MRFVDRAAAGRQLAAAVQHLRGADVVVVGLPRGGVPVAYEVARALDAPLDVIVVRKLGLPHQPELAMGAVGEGGVRVLDQHVLRVAGVTGPELAEVERRERAEVVRRALRYRAGLTPVSLAGRTVVIVDDGVATGSTARAACRIARAAGAARVVLAVPVAPADWTSRLGEEADELVCLMTPGFFYAVGQWYVDFTRTSDEEVVSCLRRAAAAARSGADLRPEGPRTPVGEVLLSLGPVTLVGDVTVPLGATGLVVFAHGSGSSRHSPRNRLVAGVLNSAGLATVLLDLLTVDEELYRANVFDVQLMAARLIGATRWLREQPGLAGMPIGYFGASTGAAAALWAAADPVTDVATVVSRGGRPDLAEPRLDAVTAPTLLIVGADDDVVLALNRQAQDRLRCENRLSVVPGATHLFEEPGALETVAILAREWFIGHLTPAGPAADRHGAR